MTVGGLAKSLAKFDPNFDVVCSIDDQPLPPGHQFKLLVFESIYTRHGERCRGADGVPSIKFGLDQIPCVKKLGF
jgi:hypothetical protein